VGDLSESYSRATYFTEYSPFPFISVSFVRRYDSPRRAGENPAGYVNKHLNKSVY
jgi:hypothetical protein